jgi:hypothetical protein
MFKHVNVVNIDYEYGTIYPQGTKEKTPELILRFEALGSPPPIAQSDAVAFEL